MTRNEHMRPGTSLSLPVPPGTRSGDPVRAGAMNGVAATHVGEGDNAATHASVITANDVRAYTFEVAGAIAGPCEPVYLTPRAADAEPVLSTAGTGAPWGYTVPKPGESGVRAATAGVAVVRPAQV